jgi:hypothetical protein
MNKAVSIEEAKADFISFENALGATNIIVIGAGYNAQNEIVLVWHDLELDQHGEAIYHHDGNLTIAPSYKVNA